MSRSHDTCAGCSGVVRTSATTLVCGALLTGCFTIRKMYRSFTERSVFEANKVLACDIRDLIRKSNKG